MCSVQVIDTTGNVSWLKLNFYQTAFLKGLFKTENKKNRMSFCNKKHDNKYMFPGMFPSFLFNLHVSHSGSTVCFPLIAQKLRFVFCLFVSIKTFQNLRLCFLINSVCTNIYHKSYSFEINNNYELTTG